MKTFRVRGDFCPHITTRRRPFDSMLSTIGEISFVRVHVSLDGMPVYAKLRSFNPGASVKDHIRKYMFERMFESDELPESGTIVEPTTGSVGINFTVAVGQLGIRVVFVVPERFNVEKQTLMRALGADVMNTPTEDGMGDAIDRAHELADELDDAIILQQFSNPLNPEAHYETTAPEVHDVLDGEVGTLIAGCSTVGTLMGMARYGRKRSESTFVTAVEPEGSFHARFHGRDVAGAPYKTEGIDTHDPATNELFDPELADELIQITDRDTHGEMQRLAAEEGHLVMPSAAANSLAATDVVERVVTSDLDLPYGVVATVSPDFSERYSSKGVYGDFESWGGWNKPARS